MTTISEGAAHLRRVMAERDLTHRNVEDMLGATSSGLVAKWLNGGQPSLGYANKMKAKLGIPTESWFKPAHDSEPPQDCTESHVSESACSDEPGRLPVPCPCGRVQ